MEVPVGQDDQHGLPDHHRVKSIAVGVPAHAELALVILRLDFPVAVCQANQDEGHDQAHKNADCHAGRHKNVSAHFVFSFM